jgi:nitrogen fixation-related uncharacterized protein
VGIKWLLGFNDWILLAFNKEALFIFSIYCALVFILALFVFTWAWKDGQFRDIEGPKLEMMEEI